MLLRHLTPIQKDSMKIKQQILFFLVALLCCGFATLHEYYLSTTVVRYVEAKGEIQMVSKLFLEDVEDYLNQENPHPFVLQPDNNPEAIEKAVELFLKSQFDIRIDGKNYTPQYLGKEYQDDLVVIYAYVHLQEAPKEIVLDNRFLLDFIPSQQNIIHFKSAKKNKSFLAKEGETRIRLVL